MLFPGDILDQRDMLLAELGRQPPGVGHGGARLSGFVHLHETVNTS